MKPQPNIISKKIHGIDKNDIDKRAIEIIHRLKEAGFEAYLVGGGVRDLLLGKHPKDFDIATNALPNQVKKLFNNCRLIGRRFRLAHIYYGSEIFEVATFRAEHNQNQTEGACIEDGRIIRDNVYGDINDDVKRRDFTVNALYFDIDGDLLLDFVGGFKDFQDRKLRVIGDPKVRYREDPIRMVRALRFAAKLDFQLEKHTAACIDSMGALLLNVSKDRLSDECFKSFYSGAGHQFFFLLRKYHLFAQLFPETERQIKLKKYPIKNFIEQTCIDTDKRIREKKSVRPAFLLAAFLWYPIIDEWKNYKFQDFSDLEEFKDACVNVILEQRKCITITKLVSYLIQDVLCFQLFLEKRNIKSIFYLVSNSKFRIAFDFLKLRSTVEPQLHPIVEWWEKFYVANSQIKDEMIEILIKESETKK